MNDLTEKEQIMRDYWLGSLAPSQTEAFETEWFGSDDEAELLEIARADLIDDYLAKDLSVAELSQFEKNFLPYNLDDVVLAKASLEISREEFADLEKENFFEKFLAGLRGFFSLPQIAAAAVLLVVCFGLWFKFFAPQSSPEVARNEDSTINSPDDFRVVPENRNNPDKTVAVDRTKDGSEDKNANVKANKTSVEPAPNGSNRNSDAIKKPSVEPRPVERRQILFLTVFRGESLKTVSLNGDKDVLTLKLTMPGIDKAYKNYRLKIYDGSDNLVVERELGGNLSLKTSGETLTMPPLKSDLFKKNSTYKTSLAGIDENGAETELIKYDSFRIKD